MELGLVIIVGLLLIPLNESRAEGHFNGNYQSNCLQLFPHSNGQHFLCELI